jgi:transaldolase
MGRLDDVSIDSAEVLGGIVDCLRPAGVTSQVLAASIRHPEHVVTAAKLGCEVATVPGKVLRQMLEHPLTAAGIARFDADWSSRPELAGWLRDLVEARQTV